MIVIKPSSDIMAVFGDRIELVLPDGTRHTCRFHDTDVEDSYNTGQVLRDQLAARDSLIVNMRHNIKEKQKFINHLLAELSASLENKKGGGCRENECEEASSGDI